MISAINILSAPLQAVAGSKWEKMYNSPGIYASTFDDASQQFVALGYNSSTVMYGPNPLSLTIATSPTVALWSRVATGNNIGVGIANGNTSTIRCTSISTKANWVAGGAISSDTWNALVFFNQRFFAFSGSATAQTYMSTIDGSTWDSHNLPETNFPTQHAFAALGKLYLVSQLTIYSSVDGYSWTQVSIPANAASTSTGVFNVSGSGFNGSTIIASKPGAAGASSSYVISSTDGLNWVESTIPTQGLVRFGVAGDTFVLTKGSSSGNTTWMSSNGVLWRKGSVQPNGTYFNMSYGNGYLFQGTTTTEQLFSVHTGSPLIHNVSQNSVLTTIHVSSSSKANIYVDINNIPAIRTSVGIMSSKVIELAQPVGAGTVITAWADAPGASISLDGVIL